MSCIDKLIATAEAELGYREKRSNSELDDKTANAGSGNYTRYARDLDAIGWFYNGPKQGFAWCDVFVDWCFVKAFGLENALRLLHQPTQSCGAGCTYSLEYFRRVGAFYGSPQVGDQIFFGAVGDSSHTGIVVGISDTTVTTIEGNTSDGVFRRTYYLGDANIAGYGRPDWASLEENAEDEPASQPPAPEQPAAASCAVILPELSVGSVGPEVRRMQRMLLDDGFSCGRCGADGEFGMATDAALRAWQSAHGMTADGCCGVITWTMLLKGS